MHIAVVTGHFVLYYHDSFIFCGLLMIKNNFYDVLVIGSGAAGLTLALQLDKHLNVALISKSTLKGGASWLAQGGIAAVFDKDDSAEAHVKDTLIAGAGLCHEDSVRYVVENGPTAKDGLSKIAFEKRDMSKELSKKVRRTNKIVLETQGTIIVTSK